VSQLVDAFEDTRRAEGLSVTEVASRARLSKRTVSLVKGGAVTPSLRTLVAWADACGLELAIRIRLKSTAGRAGVQTRTAEVAVVERGTV